jgi:hypothetical protein
VDLEGFGDDQRKDDGSDSLDPTKKKRQRSMYRYGERTSFIILDLFKTNNPKLTLQAVVIK